MDTKGVYIGRFSPMHIGHESVIRAMLEEHGRKNCVVVIGSSNAPLSTRNLFSYVERSQFIRRVFPTLNIVGLPDFLGNDREWLYALDELLNYGGINPNTALYWGGCLDDIQADIFLNAGREYRIVDRAGSDISGTAVREALYRDDYELAMSMVNPIIQNDVLRRAQCTISTLSFQ